MKKEKYVYPTIKIVYIEKNDLICCSDPKMGFNEDGDGEDNNE